MTRRIQPSISPPAREALFKAYRAAIDLLPGSIRPDFVLIGGTAMLTLGGMRRTTDVDVVITATSLHAFVDAAKADPRFSLHSDGEWGYHCEGATTAGISVPFEFLAADGGFVPNIKERRPVFNGYIPGLGELLLMKTWSYEGRGEDKDLEDLELVVRKMVEDGATLEGLEMDDDDEDLLRAVVHEMSDRALARYVLSLIGTA
ncbi:MAG: hypothetical protein M1816_004818 [Peltula sp. TS41687]|nr:MAG: hypothetical protein M1816_004818 [Peltula sp. TS41687]